jgi:hypothetical protein
MTYLFKLAQRTARLRAAPFMALAAALTACDSDNFSPSDASTPAPVSAPVSSFDAPAFASSFVGGIPFGTYALPTSAMDGTYNGTLRVFDPSVLVEELTAIRNRGGRVVLSFAGNEKYYLDGNDHFSLSLWKQRVDRHRGINISSFIQDGTIIGHYLIDEPNDAFNWGGQPVPGSTVEAMAAYSKQIWPGMATIVRVDPGYLKPWAPYTALDAAWAQYVSRKGTPSDYINRNIADAQSMGLMLISGLNLRDGGPNGATMTASLVQSAGQTILSESYICSFLSWQYDEAYLSKTDIKSAMSRLSDMAQNHVARTCARSGTVTTPPPLPGISGIALKAVAVLRDGDQVVSLTWAGAAGSQVDIYRDGIKRRTTANDGKAFSAPRPGTYEFRVCEAGKTRCSNRVTVTIK